MWIKQNEDTSYTVTNAFWTVIDGAVTLVDATYDKRKKPRGFEWEADQSVIDGYLQHNADLIATELLTAMETDNVNNSLQG